MQSEALLPKCAKLWEENMQTLIYQAWERFGVDGIASERNLSQDSLNKANCDFYICWFPKSYRGDLSIEN